MANKIQIRRGAKANLPTLSVGEMGLTTDTNEVYIGTNGGNLRIDAKAAPVTSVAGKTGAVTLAKGDVGLGSVDNTADSSKSVASAAKLTTARTINGVSFNGTANINIPTGISDASTDGKLYGRKNGAWEEVQTSSPYKTFGVHIDLSNSNPDTSVSYIDDAIGMTGGSAGWNAMSIFKDIKPCVLKNGIVQYYLNPADFTKKADGSAADITSGNDGDVMIEFPKTGFQINTSGNDLTIKITDDPNKEGFRYYAHTRDAEGDRDKLYIGAYKGSFDGSKLRSLSGKAPDANKNIGTFRTNAQANGAGYDQFAFYPLTLIQCLYLIRFKSLNCQTALGRGFVDGNSAAINTGGTNAKGMFFGETTGKLQMKCFGIEDLWGNVYDWIDGLWSDASRNICTAFKNFNDTGSGYTNRGQGATANVSGYMTVPQGTSEAGFITKTGGGSETIYFSDYAYLSASRLPFFGGGWGNAGYAGVFLLVVNYSASYVNANVGGRLMYL